MSIFPRSIWLSFATLFGLIGLQGFMLDPARVASVAPPAAASTAVAVDFVGNTAIELTRLTATDASATVLVRNDSDREAWVWLEAVLLDRRGQPLARASQTQLLKPNRPTPITISLSPSTPPFDLWRDGRLPARGSVVLTARAAGSPVAPAAIKSRELVLLQVQPSTAEFVITIAGLAAAILVALAGWFTSATPPENAVSPRTLTWTPQSWSTNLAIGGALLTTVLGIAALPAQTHFAARTTYTALSAFFATLVALAPAVYGLLKVGGTPTMRRALTLFAFAAAITVWATIGQLGTAGLLFLELESARVISWPSAYAAAAVFAIVGVLVFVHACRAVSSFPAPAPAPAGGPAPPPGAAAPAWPLL